MDCAFCGNKYNSRRDSRCTQCHRTRAEQKADRDKYIREHVETVSTESAYGHTVAYPFALKVF